MYDSHSHTPALTTSQDAKGVKFRSNWWKSLHIC